jgi:predicted HicB family RNase H-like nuclease
MIHEVKEVKERFNVNVRLSKKESEKLQILAAQEMLSMSAYVRRAVFLIPTKEAV